MPTTLEQTMPVYHFHERHSRWIDASPEQVWHALTTLTLDQLTLTRALVAIRHIGAHPATPAKPCSPTGQFGCSRSPHPPTPSAVRRPDPDSTGRARSDIASLEEFARFAEPGWTKYLTDFHLQPGDGGVLLTAETRGYSTDSRARRFAVYWALIRPASGLVRRDMLATVRRRTTPQP